MRCTWLSRAAAGREWKDSPSSYPECDWGTPEELKERKERLALPCLSSVLPPCPIGLRQMVLKGYAQFGISGRWLQCLLGSSAFVIHETHTIIFMVPICLARCTDAQKRLADAGFKAAEAGPQDVPPGRPLLLLMLLILLLMRHI